MAIDHPAAAALKAQFPTAKLRGATFRGQTQIIVPAEQFTAIVKFLKEGPLGYDFLSDISAVDYLNFPGSPKEARFGLLYVFSSVSQSTERLLIRVFLDDPNPTVDSLVPLYAGAEWLEREVFDMFGITFANHPDMRRILTWDTFVAHPLRKDYPVIGRGEREQYPIVTRDSA